jgi:hypothetical protein
MQFGGQQWTFRNLYIHDCAKVRGGGGGRGARSLSLSSLLRESVDCRLLPPTVPSSLQCNPSIHRLQVGLDILWNWVFIFVGLRIEHVRVWHRPPRRRVPRVSPAAPPRLSSPPPRCPSPSTATWTRRTAPPTWAAACSSTPRSPTSRTSASRPATRRRGPR